MNSAEVQTDTMIFFLISISVGHSGCNNFHLIRALLFIAIFIQTYKFLRAQLNLVGRLPLLRARLTPRKNEESNCEFGKSEFYDL